MNSREREPTLFVSLSALPWSIVHDEVIRFGKRKALICARREGCS